MIEPGNVNSLFDAEVVDSADEKVGTVKQVYLDTDTGEPLFITVATGFFGMSESFVPVADASFDGEVLRVGFDKATVKHAPRMENDGVLSEDEEERIWAYYSGDDAERRPDTTDDTTRPDDRATSTPGQRPTPDYGAGVPVPLSGTVDEERREFDEEAGRPYGTPDPRDGQHDLRDERGRAAYEGRPVAAEVTDPGRVDEFRPGPDDPHRGPADDLRVEDPADAAPMTDPAARLRRGPAGRPRLRRHTWVDPSPQTAVPPDAEAPAGPPPVGEHPDRRI